MTKEIICKITNHGIHSFYLIIGSNEYFLFNQNYRKGVQQYYGRGVVLENAIDHGKSHGDEALIRTMSKIPAYIKYVESEYDIIVLNRTAKKNNRKRQHSMNLVA